MNTTAGNFDQSFSADEHAGKDTGEGRPRPLVRDASGRMLAGVASGIAGYLAVDVLLVRIAFVVLTLFGGIGIPLYLACWLLIPDQDTGQSIVGDVTASRQARHN